MKGVIKIATSALLLLPSISPANEGVFRLSDSHNISCGRDLSRGKLRTATCRSYAYLFDTRTSQHFRCQMSLLITRRKNEVLQVETDGGCVKRQRIFSDDSTYDLGAAETEPTNMNTFFGSGGHAVWAADTARRTMRGCIIISSALGSNISQCADMKFD